MAKQSRTRCLDDSKKSKTEESSYMKSKFYRPPSVNTEPDNRKLVSVLHTGQNIPKNKNCTKKNACPFLIELQMK